MQGAGFRVQGTGFRVQGTGIGLRARGAQPLPMQQLPPPAPHPPHPPAVSWRDPCYIKRFLATKVTTQMLKVNTKSTQCVVIFIEMIFQCSRVPALSSQFKNDYLAEM